MELWFEGAKKGKDKQIEARLGLAKMSPAFMNQGFSYPFNFCCVALLYGCLAAQQKPVTL
jgi:hypothetical protein